MKKTPLILLLLFIGSMVLYISYNPNYAEKTGEEELFFYNYETQTIEFNKNSIKTLGIINIVDENGMEINLEYPSYKVITSKLYRFVITYLDTNGQTVEKIKEIEITIHQDITIEEKVSDKVGRALVPDNNFYTYLVEHFQLSPEFTIDDLKTITGINYRGDDKSKRITNIQGVEYMTSLRYLYLNDHAVKTLEPMRNTIYPYMVQMEFNNWKDGSNEIKDFSMLDCIHFPNFNQQLMFNNNNIDDEAFQTLPQTNIIQNGHFFFQANKITNIQPLKKYTSLIRLDLRYNQISNLEALSSLTNIKELSLSNNQIVDVSPLASMSLQENSYIWLNNNQIADLSPLKDIEAFVYASISTLESEQFGDISTNIGQQINLNEIYADIDTKEVLITSTAINREGKKAKFQVDGKKYEQLKVVLNPDVDTAFTYDVEYTNANTRYKGCFIQPIIWWKKPIFEYKPLEVFQNTSIDYLEGITAMDYEGEDITTSIKIIEDTVDIQKAGTYEVKYEVSDKHGFTRQETRIVKVHSEPMKMPTIICLNQGGNTLENTVLLYGENTYLKAQDGVATKPIETEILKEDVVYDFSKVEINQIGVQDFTYHLQIGKTSFQKQGKILITSANTLENEDGSILLDAQSFSISTEEAKNLQMQDIPNLSAAHAFQLTLNKEQEIEAARDISNQVKIPQQDLKKIQAVTNLGGIFPITFLVDVNGLEITKTGFITVLGDNSEQIEQDINNTFITNAKDIKIAYYHAKSIEKEAIIEESEVMAIHKESQTPIQDYEIEEEQLSILHEVGTIGGEYEIVIYAMYKRDTKEYRIPIKIKVSIIGEMIKYPIKKQNSESIYQKKTDIPTVDTTNQKQFMFLLFSSFIYVIKTQYKRKRNKIVS